MPPSIYIKGWKRLLDLNNPNHGLLLPILEKMGRPVLAKPRPGLETAHFIEHEAYKDIALVIPPSANSTTSPTTIRSDRRRRADQRAI
ncbi:hypothetical protein NKI12_30650 [Mesorhizobium australicum]|uniref:Uncharacterized protein n=1 Tax=Mesorhizobium australicum TaxID=536018 RepID=A0ACC6T9B4_9HYPH